jgi:hypothetical protein
MVLDHGRPDQGGGLSAIVTVDEHSLSREDL